jgi:hypothetical protein
MDNMRPYDKTGITVFETPKDENTKFDGLRMRIGAGFTQSYQAITQENAPDTGAAFKLRPVAPGFNTAQANLNTDFMLDEGVRLSLTLYLSARHHNETWVKGGYILFDKMNFLGSDAINSLMKYLTIRVGHMEINYGDAHFRRTDGGNSMYNAFADNYLIDAFTTEIGGDVMFRSSGFLALAGVTSGAIKGNVDQLISTKVDKDTSKAPAFMFKAGYDKNFADALRVRVTGSFYTASSSAANTLFWGDRTGSSYFMVLEPTTATYTGNAWSGRINPGFSDKVTAMQFNGFFKVALLEFFATYK